MKKFTLVLFIFSSIHCFAQTKNTSNLIATADKSYQSASYFVAAYQYQRAAQQDSTNNYIKSQLAECYRNLHDYKNAESLYFQLATKDNSSYPTARFWYASILKDNGEFLNAKEQFEQFRRDIEGNLDFELELYKEKALQEIIDCTRLEEKVKSDIVKTYSLTCLPPPVNSNLSDFSPVIGKTDDELVVTSAKAHIGSKAAAGQTDIHRFTKTSDLIWEPLHHTHNDKFGALNSHYNESSGSFTGDYKKYYFTRCDDQIMMDKHIEFNCAIYVSSFENGKWGAAKRLNENINAPGQWNAQPSVSPDGGLLFFVSKRPGGAGMHDIWYSTSNGDDEWIPAQNLQSVNTVYMDVTPKYNSAENVIFFSSNGQGGFGGLDIFMSKAEDGFSKVYSLKRPFNSNRDDFYFTPGKKVGYFSSNRKGGQGDDDIYRFEFPNGIKELIEDTIAE